MSGGVGDDPVIIAVVAGGHERVVGRLPVGVVDLELVDALARLQLVALRHGATIALRGAGNDLVALLRLAGLGEVPMLRGLLPGLVDEPRREAELGEELRREEVVQPGDEAVG